MFIVLHLTLSQHWILKSGGSISYRVKRISKITVHSYPVAGLSGSDYRQRNILPLWGLKAIFCREASWGHIINLMKVMLSFRKERRYMSIFSPIYPMFIVLHLTLSQHWILQSGGSISYRVKRISKITVHLLRPESASPADLPLFCT